MSEVKLHHGDCLQILPALEAGSVDMILADPPYGTTACSWDSVIDLPAMWKELKRVIKPNGAIVLFGADPFTSVLITSNLPMFKYRWVWHKSRAADFVNAKNKPMRSHEDITVFSKGGTANGSKVKMCYFPQDVTPVLTTTNPRKNKFGSIAGKRPSHKKEYLVEGANYPTTVLYFPSEFNTVHPTQKPVSILRYLIRTYTNKGDTILDFCMGSGSTGVACVLEERSFIGIENDTEHGYFEIAQKRIQEAQTTPRTMAMELTA